MADWFLLLYLLNFAGALIYYAMRRECRTAQRDQEDERGISSHKVSIANSFSHSGFRLLLFFPGKMVSRGTAVARVGLLDRKAEGNEAAGQIPELGSQQRLTPVEGLKLGAGPGGSEYKTGVPTGSGSRTSAPEETCVCVRLSCGDSGAGVGAVRQKRSLYVQAFPAAFFGAVRAWPCWEGWPRTPTSIANRRALCSAVLLVLLPHIILVAQS